TGAAGRSTARCCRIWRSTSRRRLRPSSRRPRPPSPRDGRAMIDVAYVQRLTRYNRWQNESLYGVADTLSDAERKRARGAFFGSIHATLNHLLWADRIWLSRLAGTPRPEGCIPESAS